MTARSPGRDNLSGPPRRHQKQLQRKNRRIEMITELSDDQIASYRENGFIVLEGFLTPEETEHWRQTTQEAVDQRLASLQNATSGSVSGVSDAVAELEENRL